MILCQPSCLYLYAPLRCIQYIHVYVYSIYISIVLISGSLPDVEILLPYLYGLLMGGGGAVITTQMTSRNRVPSVTSRVTMMLSHKDISGCFIIYLSKFLVQLDNYIVYLEASNMASIDNFWASLALARFQGDSTPFRSSIVLCKLWFYSVFFLTEIGKIIFFQ